MACTIVLYGATGYSGRLIAEELADLRAAHPPGAWRIVLAGRSAERLQVLADALEMESSAFDLEDDGEARRALAALDVDVIINAAGPFDHSGRCLVAAALQLGCHYTDINGEAEVYQRLERKGDDAGRKNVALVVSAGFWAAASNLMLDTALQAPATVGQELGAIRIVMSRIKTFSRGSAQTVWRSLRRHVTVVRKGRNAQGRDALLRWHEPVGKLERSFNFAYPRKQADRRIASAASLVDTLCAQEALDRRGQLARTIESYVEAGLPARVAYQFGACMAPLVAVPAIRAVAQQPAALLPEGPTPAERMGERHIILLEIEDALRSTLIDWRWETPNVYQFTARAVVAVAAQLGLRRDLSGWLTPAEVLRPLQLQLTAQAGPLRGCRLHRRRG